MIKIVSDFTGSSRMPMIIIDCPGVLKNRNMFSARAAGILGFSIFGSKKIYALDDDMKIDVKGLRDFLDTYKGQKILLFGFRTWFQQLIPLKIMAYWSFFEDTMVYLCCHLRYYIHLTMYRLLFLRCLSQRWCSAWKCCCCDV